MSGEPGASEVTAQLVRIEIGGQTTTEINVRRPN